MKTNLILTMAATAIALVGCKMNKDAVTDDQKSEIRLTSGVSALTRTSFGIDTQIASGQTVAVYVDNTATPAEEIYGNNVLTADGAGAFTGGTEMYFPIDKTGVDVYAYHTNGTSTSNFPTAAITHTVSNDQSAITGYASSDLLYSIKKGVAFTKDAVNLTFYHMLSKVEVALKVGAGIPELAGATVSIVGTQLKADFKPNKIATMATQSERAAMITLAAADNTAADIKIGSNITADFTTPNYNEAIIIPQIVAGNAKFIKITLANNSELYYKMEAQTIFESGKKYLYHITVNLTGLTVTSTITDWDPITAVEGGAEME